ncbi:similar to Saccharomyces cerevisiae YOR144C ELG1 Subunit of an alternative replication factor C complex important for DNA replication and genome integrity [Maudiozyma saulgeensis]|uniref:Similar to Saccharomyces cerevisiae YOR144C ELG1 Subunit of an alternative replication factor C complex important for DNA replication and genome integrity n=1 Tax=Maudiozyma saulgeensis TaxID=1789683 RepID=A0A1X7QY24_9SACH|nr:similar to Saccharomyces cerevisiae YOR144C ELG1 Subunit of an alternative replication factor C complex important for DNA replication and genome integrity [Kazachstania saulgeensis]
MKRTTPVSLKSILSGNPTKKPKVEKKRKTEDKTNSKNDELNIVDLESSTLSNGVDEDNSLIGARSSSSPSSPPPISSSVLRLNSSRQHIIPTGNNVKSQSMKSFLMKSKPINDPKKAQPTVISLDDTSDDDETKNNNDIEITKINLQPSKLSTDTSIKRTNLKDLFSGFGKPTPEHQLPGYHGPINRLNDISKLKQIEAPFPTRQLIEPSQNEIAPNNMASLKLHRRSKSLDNKDDNTDILDSFLSSEYESLNKNRSQMETTKHSKMISYTIGPNKYSQQWPELMKPTSVKNVLLESKLKQNVSKWIDTSIEKLKRPTTRNTLLRTYKEEVDEFKNFIIHDDYESDTENGGIDTDNGSLEEFVPLSILHGEGLGKDTLIYTIAKEKGYQIYEINTSQNRGRKDILSTLTDYCTTYYVKDKNESGIVLISDVDIIFKERDKHFWSAVEMLLLKSRKPIILTCKDCEYVPTNLLDICTSSDSLFNVKKVSTRSVLEYLIRYCDILELDLDKEVLRNIVKNNNNDIRKCLLQLQFWFSSGTNINMSSTNPSTTSNNITNIKQLSKLLDVNSIDDIILSSTWDKSSIQQEDDNTLMTNDIVLKFQEMKDDEDFRLANDYIIDYRIHTQHYNHLPLLSFELNIGSELKQMLVQHCNHFLPNNYNYPHRYNKMKKAIISFIETRMERSMNSSYTKIRSTRNSRKIRDIVDMFKGEHTNSQTIDERVRFDMNYTSKRNICEQINPFVYEIAKYELASREYNYKLYKVSIENASPEEHDEIVKKLLEDGLTKQLKFSANSDKVVNSWK